MKQNPVYNVLVVEDEEPAVEILRHYIKNRAELVLRDVVHNGKEALGRLSSVKYDIVFMDIDIPVLSGIEVLELLDDPPYIIFTTASSQHAVRAFELSAVDYLVKPFSLDRFSRAVEKAVENIMKKDTVLTGAGTLGLSCVEGGTRYLIPFDEIIYLSSSGRHSIIHTEKKDYETPRILGLLGEKLPEAMFMRIHKRYIANLGLVSCLKNESGGEYTLVMRDGDSTPLPVGRTFIGALRGRME